MKNIDFHQLKIIIKYGIIQELRGRSRGKGDKKSYRTLISLVIVYGFSGFFLGSIAAYIKDPFTSAFISATFFMILAGSFILLEYPTLVTGAEDFSFYSTKPVNSATYFTAKLLTVLTTISLFFLFFMLPYGTIFLLRGGAPVLLAGNAMSVYFSGIIITLILINLYGFLVKYIPYSVIRGVTSLLQIVIMFLIYGINIFAFQSIRGGQFDIVFSLSPGMLFVPSAWVSAVYQLSSGLLPIIAVLLAVLVIPLMLYLSTRIVSLGYAEKIAGYMVKSETTGTDIKKVSFLWKTPEELVVFRLIKNQFKYNNQFRMGMLMILPITVLYFFIVIFMNKAPILDPFTPVGRSSFMETIVLYMAIGLYPMYIKNALLYSSEAEACWILFTSPISRLNMILAARKFILVFFLVPYLVIFAGVFLFFTGAPVHTLMHFTVIFLLAFILTNLLLLFNAKLPFTLNPQKGRRVLQLYLRVFLAFLLPVPLTLFVLFLYPQMYAYVILVVVLLAICIMLEVTGRKVARRKLELEEYVY